MADYMAYRPGLKDNLKPTNLRPTNHQQNRSPYIARLPDEVDHPRTAAEAQAEYRFESARLQSFANWPLSYMDPVKLAAAGFYYMGNGDYCKCFECGVVICQWEEGDNPMTDHQRWRSTCNFIRKLPCGNVPIGVDPSTVPPPAISYDVCGFYGEDNRPNASPDFRTSQNEFQFPSAAKLGSIGLATPKGPVHPEYASYDARLKTFDSWPKSMPQTKEQLADAGFYYTRTGDQTLCYHCGGGLRDWEPNDDPWIQHAKWFKKCYYVLMVKGQSFINSVIGQPVTLPSREETMQMNLPSYIEKVEASPPCNSTVTATTSEIQVESTKLAESNKSNNKPADDARLCKICYNAELGIVFLPCGHMIACTKCAPGMTSCAVCREPISMIVRAIIS